jgi:hypothetical protein
MTFIECDLVGVGESVNFLVGSPVLNTGISCSTTVKLVLSHEVLVVKGVEVSSLTLVWEFG